MPRRFPVGSRYTTTEVAVWADDAGREFPYLRRRFVPRTAPDEPVGVHLVRQGERLDGIAARHLGDPSQFWALCDVNEVLRPADLETTGREILLPEAG